MKNVFLIFLCTSLFELYGMEIERIIGLNYIPDELIIERILPIAVPKLYLSILDDEKKLYDAVKIVKNQDTILQKSISHIALINKRFYTVVMTQCIKQRKKIAELIQYTENSQAKYLLLGLLDCFEPQVLQPINIAFERENEWWKIEKEELMQVQFSYIINTSDRILIHICFKGFTQLPITFNNEDMTFFIKKDNVKIANLENTFLTQLSKIVYTLSNNTISKGYHAYEHHAPIEHRRVLQYFFDLKRDFAAQDAVLLCSLAQQIAYLKKDSELKKNYFELLYQKIKGLLFK